MKIAILLFLSLFLIQCKNLPKSFISKDLSKKWEISSLRTPESVKYDPKTRQLFVSDVNGDPWAKDGNGFITRITIDGKFAEVNWVIGMDAPKGMGIYKGHLYVSDITEIDDIDIAKGAIVKRYISKDAKYFNDIEVDSAGVVYISDMFTNSIYRLINGKLERWIQSSELDNCNGLYCQSGKLYIGTKTKIITADLATGKLCDFITDTGPIDGLRRFDDNEFICSDWTGSVFRIGTDTRKKMLLNTSFENINAADIEYIPELRMLVVPTFYNDRVVAYELK
jgi:hypothetical protein